MSSMVKIVIVAAVALGELVVMGVVIPKLMDRDQSPAALALILTSAATVTATGYVLFLVLD